jgi:hypothetical protein
MNPHNSKLVTILGLVATISAGVAALTQWSTFGAVGHYVVLALGLVGAVAAAVGKSLTAPAA